MLIERFLLTSPITIDRGSISLINAACEKLKVGTSTVDDLWPGELRSLSTLLSDKALFEKAQKEVWVLMEASRAVGKLQSSINAKIHFLQKTVKPAALHRGLVNMPDEILERVLSKILLEMNPTNPPSRVEYKKKVESLSLVNRRFRSVVMSMPVMLIDERREELSWEAIQLRKRHVHALLFNGDTFNSRVKNIVNNLVVLTFLSKSPWTSRDKDIYAKLLPRLEELTLYDCGEFLAVHQLPSLKRLYTSIDSSDMSKLATVMPQLTHLSIKVKISTPDALPSIAAALAVGQQLHHLDLRFTSTMLIDFRGFLYPRNSYCLPAMESLQLELQTQYIEDAKHEGGQAYIDAMSAFLHSFEFPSLGRLGLMFRSTRSTTGDPFKGINVAQCFFSVFRHKDSLRHLSLSRSSSAFYDLSTMAIQDWLNYFPSLQSLALANIRIRLDDSSLTELARLQDITIDDCILSGQSNLQGILAGIFHSSCINIKSLRYITNGKCHSSDFNQLDAISSEQRISGRDFYVELAHLDSPLGLPTHRSNIYDFDDADRNRDQYDVDGFDIGNYNTHYSDPEFELDDFFLPQGFASEFGL